MRVARSEAFGSRPRGRTAPAESRGGVRDRPRGTYGSPRVRDELVDQGFPIGRKPVARLMREMGLRGVCPPKFRATTDSDHDQYASTAYRGALDAVGIECSMSRRANYWDNAVGERFFGTLKSELIYRRPWLTQEEARNAIADYIEIFCNRIRRHSTIGGVSPAKFEEEAGWAA
jgi:transposase InsO family protein